MNKRLQFIYFLNHILNRVVTACTIGEIYSKNSCSDFISKNSFNQLFSIQSESFLKSDLGQISEVDLLVVPDAFHDLTAAITGDLMQHMVDIAPKNMFLNFTTSKGSISRDWFDRLVEQIGQPVLVHWSPKELMYLVTQVGNGSH